MTCAQDDIQFMQCLLLLFLRMGVACAYVHVLFVCLVPREARMRSWDPLKLELQTVV